MTLEEFFKTKGNIFMQFDSAEESLEFLKECEKKNLLWNSGRFAVERNYREKHNDACYSINEENRLFYKHKKQITSGCAIINYKDLIKTDIIQPNILRAIYDSI